MLLLRGIAAAIKPIVVAAAVVAFASAAVAQDLDFSKLPCKEFVAAPKDKVGTILAWLEAFYTKEGAPPIMYADKTQKDAQALNTYCNSHPDDDMIKAADTVMPIK